MPLAQPAVHKSRNFKGLQLHGVGGVAQGPPASYEGPSRGASLLAAPDGEPYGARSEGGARGMPFGLGELLSPRQHHRTMPPAPGSAHSTSSMPDGDRSPTGSAGSGSGALSDRVRRMDLGHGGQERVRHYALGNEHLEMVRELGAGNGGTVSQVVHKPSGTVMAKKVVFIDAKPEVRKQIVRELQVLHECCSDCIIDFYGAYLTDAHIAMCMEYMDVGSLDAIYRAHGPIEPEVCGKVVDVVVHGLAYLYEEHRIIHRDVKPNNILVNSGGEIKLCDFGVSGELINSIADTFVGTSTYMSPERIQGDQYTIKSDVWSLGVTMVELAHGRFPFADDAESEEAPTARYGGVNTVTTADPGGRRRAAVQEEQPMSILELLQHIVFEPPPRLNPHWNFPESMVHFVNACLSKDPTQRPTPMDLRHHPFVRQAHAYPLDLVGWVRGLKLPDEPGTGAM